MTQHITYKGVVWRTGARVLLCPPTEDCIEPVQHWINTERNTRFILAGTPMSLSAQETWTKRRMEHNPNDFTIFIRTYDGTLIGNMGLHIDTENQSAVTGTLFGNQDYQRGGYATEAKLLLLRHAFLERGLRKVTSYIMGPNRASVKYARRCGYRFYARIPAEHFVLGKWRSKLVYIAWPHTWYEADAAFKARLTNQ